jgi:hypothetical protein
MARNGDPEKDRLTVSSRLFVFVPFQRNKVPLQAFPIETAPILRIGFPTASDAYDKGNV